MRYIPCAKGKALLRNLRWKLKNYVKYLVFPILYLLYLYVVISNSNAHNLLKKQSNVVPQETNIDKQDHKIILNNTVHSLLEDKIHRSDMTVVEPSSRNNTPEETRILVYNRVPKCGSETALSLLHKLSYKNNYRQLSSHIYDVRNLSSSYQYYMTKKWLKKSSKRPVAYNKHMYFFEVTEDSAKSRITWFNLVRDPVSRFISDYYYVRSKKRWHRNRQLKKNPKPTKSWFNYSLDDCIAERSAECWPQTNTPFEMQLTYFCGSSLICSTIGSNEALQTAKMNIEKYYSVVGVLEELPVSFQVMEYYLPLYFSNIGNFTSATQKHKNRNPDKREISDKSVSILRSLLKEDIELYGFIKQRLHLQADKLRRDGFIH